jgi:hypothetical protein
LKIAFAGVSSTGKTTLSGMTRDALGLPYVHEPLEEAFEECERRSIPTSTRDVRTFTNQDKVRFEIGMYKAHQRLENECGDHFITDSALIVPAMYMKYYCLPIQPEIDSEMMYREALERLSNYDHVFYLPGGRIPIVDDNRRLTHRLMLKTMDSILKGIINDARKQGYNNIHQVDAIDKHDRLRFVLHTLGYRTKSDSKGNVWSIETPARSKPWFVDRLLKIVGTFE